MVGENPYWIVLLCVDLVWTILGLQRPALASDAPLWSVGESRRRRPHKLFLRTVALVKLRSSQQEVETRPSNCWTGSFFRCSSFQSILTERDIFQGRGTLEHCRMDFDQLVGRYRLLLQVSTWSGDRAQRDLLRVVIGLEPGYYVQDSWTVKSFVLKVSFPIGAQPPS